MKTQLRPKAKSFSALRPQKKKTTAQQRQQDAWADWIATLEAEGEDVPALLAQTVVESGLRWSVEEESAEQNDLEDKTEGRATEASTEDSFKDSFEDGFGDGFEQIGPPSGLGLQSAAHAWVGEPKIDIAETASVGERVEAAAPLVAESVVEPVIFEGPQDVSGVQILEEPVEAEQGAVEQGAAEQISESALMNSADSWFASKKQAIAYPPPTEANAASNTNSPLSAAQLDTLLTAAPTAQLPYRPLLEARFGQSLGTIQVHPSTPTIRAVLTELDATAANYNHRILFAEPQPSLETVVHEVIHALQTQSDTLSVTAPTAPLTPLSLTSPAEQEASQLTAEIVPTLHSDSLRSDSSAPWAPVVVSSTLSSTEVACLRNAPPATLGPAATPRDTFQANAKTDRAADSAPTTAAATDTSATTTSEPSTVQVQPEDSQTTNSNAGASAPSDADASSPITDELETVPALEVPAPPEPGITAEDVAQRQAELDAAQSALENATDVDDKVAAYAKAPPTLKAKAYGTLGSDLETLSKSESETFQAEMPDFEAKLSGKTEELPELAVESPPAEENVALEEKPPAPAPKPTVEPTATPTAYTENDAVLNRIFKFSEGTSPQSKAGEIGDTLSAVSTTDKTVETSPGEAPTVPLQGESDPERIETQVSVGRDRATKDRDNAKKKVLEGPGPERIQPLVMEEKMPMEALAAPTVERPEPVAGIDDFGQREMPAEVNTAFDLTHQESMQASMTEAQSEVQKTTEARDKARKDEVDKAQSDADKKTAAADKQQREDVQTHRENIQRDRKTAIDTQNKAVKDVEKDSETRRKADKAAIDSRVKEDQKTVKADYSKAEGKAKEKVKGGEKKSEDKRNQAERDAEKESWWDRAVSFVKKAIQALTDAISEIFDKVRAAVNKILDDVKKAALALIDKAANFIKKAISKFSKFLQGAVNALLKEHFPGAAKILTDAIKQTEKLATEAVDKVATKLKKEITELVEGLRKSLNAIMDALQAGLKFVSTSIQAALSGDWGAVLKMLLEAVFKVIGVEPETFYAFIGKAQETFQKILDDPGAVVKNLLDAVKLGIQKFADNFLKHLKAGIIGWLTGALGSDLTIPKEFSLIGVLDLGRQIMGLTLQLIRRIAVRILGEKNVEKIEGVIEQVKSLIEGGWSGLLKRITETLTGVKEMVLGQIKEFLVTRLILSAITKLASLFNPVGAIVQLALTLWNIFTFLKENLQRMIGIVKTITASITEIFKGIVEKAAINIETTLANLLPIAISFLANLLGLGGISARVRKIIGRLRKRIEDAIVKLIRKLARAIAKGGRKVAKKAKRAIKKFKKWWGAKTTLKANDGLTHTLYFKGTGKSAVLMVRTKPTPFTDFVDRAEINSDSKKATAQTKARAIAVQIDTERNTPVTGATDEEKAKAETAKFTKVKNLLDSLKPYTQVLFTSAIVNSYHDNNNINAPPQATSGFGTRMSIKPLTNKNRPAGTPPTAKANATYKDLNQRRTKPGGSAYYMKGHLLSEELGGLGEWKNITPLSRSGNGLHETRAESIVKKTVNLPANVEYIVEANYITRGDKTALLARIARSSRDSASAKRAKTEIVNAEDSVPVSLSIKVYILKDVSGTLRRQETILDSTIPNKIDRDFKSYFLLSSRPPTAVNLSTDDETKLTTLPGVGPALAKKIVEFRDEREDKGLLRFASYEQLTEVSGMTSSKIRAIKALDYVDLY